MARVGRYTHAARRWARLLARGRPEPGVRVFYGHDAVPAAGEAVAGGSAKFQRLATRFPNHPTDFSLFYLGSTWLPRDLRPLLWHARRRRIPLLLNQNGVAYPGWAGAETDAFNRPLRLVLGAAEHVLYQSEFCKRASDELVGERRVVGGPPQRGRRSALHTGRAPPPRAGPSSSSAATSIRRTGSSSGCRPSPRSSPRAPTLSSSLRAVSSLRSSRWSNASAYEGTSTSSGATRRRTRPPSSDARTSFSIRR